MKRASKSNLICWLVVVVLGTALAALGGCMKACNKNRARVNPWARALPRTSAAYGLPRVADATITVNRRQLLLAGVPLLKLKDGRLLGTVMRDGVDGLYITSLAQKLRPLAKRRPDGDASYGRLAIHCQPAVPFRTLRAVLYTAMRAGFRRPWLVAEGASGKRVGLPLELPSVVSDLGHGLRPSPTRTPALAVGLQGRGIHVTRWGRANCPQGDVAGPAGCPSLFPFPAIMNAASPRLSAYLRDRYRASASRPGRRRPPSNALMVWAGLDEPMGHFVKLLDAAREAPGGAGSCKLVPDEKTHRWKRVSGLLNPAGKSNQGCLYYQTVLVWSRPGHRKP